jgi:hypothetical protein
MLAPQATPAARVAERPNPKPRRRASPDKSRQTEDVPFYSNWSGDFSDDEGDTRDTSGSMGSSGGHDATLPLSLPASSTNHDDDSEERLSTTSSNLPVQDKGDYGVTPHVNELSHEDGNGWVYVSTSCLASSFCVILPSDIPGVAREDNK